MKERLIEAIVKFGNKIIAVAGDAFLDKYIYGRVERINPEKRGAPLLRIQREEYRLGGAGNVAMNIRSLGAKTLLNCAIGDDPESNILKGLCSHNGIKLYSVKRCGSIIKERFIEMVDNQYILRADYGESDLRALDEDEIKHLYGNLEKKKFDALVLSDYDKGVFKGDFGKQLIDLAEKKDVLSIVDTKPANASSFRYATLISPNLKEAREILGGKNLEGRTLLEELRKKVKSDYALVTLAERGIACYDGIDYNEIPTKAREVADVCGAGDTVRAAIALGLISGLNLVEAAHLGNYAAGVVVEKQGTATLTQEELIKRIKEDGNV